jgi:hypothetical protein
VMIGGAELILAPEIRTPELTLRWIGRPPGDAKLLRLRRLILTSSRACSIHLNALSFRDQAAKIALWKFPASKFHSRN